MENSYGIGVANRYALFLDDDADPLEVLKVQEQEKELKKKTKVAEKENKIKTEVPPKTKPAPTGPRKTIKETQNVKSQEKREVGEVKKNGPPRNTDQRGERNVKFSGENREERNNRRNRDDKPSFNGATENSARFNRDDRPPRRNDNRGSGGDNDTEAGSRGGRGGPPGNRPRQPRGDGVRRNFENRGKREFDRQSGSDKTGVKPVDKRDGAGAHNWGSHKDEIEEITKPPIDPIDTTWENVDKIEGTAEGTEQKPTDPNAVNAADSTTAGGEPASSTVVSQPTAEEEVKELTLDEWKAQKAAGRQKPQYNLRKAGEGEDLTQWKKMYALNKKKGEETDETDDEEYDASEYPQRVGRQKHVLDIEVRFSDSRRGGLAGSRARGGPRGGRGGDRGERGGDRGERGGDRGERGGDRGERGGDRGERGGDRGERGGDRGERGGDRGERGGPGGGERGPGNKERNKNFRNNPPDDQGASGVAAEEPAGGGRAEKGGGNARQNARQSAPKVDDEHDFPSLG